MNKDRRKTIAAIYEQLEQLAALRDNIVEQIETIRDEEQDYYDNMPESLQGGEKGDVASAAIDALDNAVNGLQDISCDDVAGYLSEAEA